MALPDNGVIFEWANDDVDIYGNPTKAFPPEEIAQTGLLVGEPWPRLWHNQALNNLSKWVQHLSGQAKDAAGVNTGGAEPIGTSKQINITVMGGTVNGASVSELWAGTWEFTGALTHSGSDVVHIFTKTAY